MFRFVSIIGLIILCFVSCENSHPGFSKLDSGTYYKIHYLGDGEHEPVEGNHIQARLVYKTMGDTVIFDTQWNHFEGLKMFSLSKDKSKLTEALCLLREGDSATFILEQNHIQVDSFRIDLERVKQVKVDVKIKSIMTQAEYEEELDIYQSYLPDLKDTDVDVETRALADLALVLFNTNEFLYVY